MTFESTSIPKNIQNSPFLIRNWFPSSIVSCNFYQIHLIQTAFYTNHPIRTAFYPNQTVFIVLLALDPNLTLTFTAIATTLVIQSATGKRYGRSNWAFYVLSGFPSQQPNSHFAGLLLVAQF